LNVPFILLQSVYAFLRISNYKTTCTCIYGSIC